jgi:hypothetical protein
MSVFEKCQILFKELKQFQCHIDEKDCLRLQKRCEIFESFFENKLPVNSIAVIGQEYFDLEALFLDILSFIIQYTKRIDFCGMLIPTFRKRYLSSLASLHQRIEQLCQTFNLSTSISKEEKRKQDIEVCYYDFCCLNSF